MASRLNLGCGLDIRKGFINVDRCVLEGVDLVCDLNTFPYPFRDDTFDEIRAYSIIEHLHDTIGVVNELHRILKDRGVLRILVPYWNSRSAFGDVTHVRYFDFESFDFLDDRKPSARNRGYYCRARFRIEQMDYLVNLGFLGRGKTLYFRGSFFSGIVKECLKYIPNTIQGLFFELRCLKSGSLP
ncbi:MAG: methyltransferase domain-containing protein [Deltaproteobacteria bacterium]|nr:methyltransferase domain-containing protein [Deltaproteobacteria bacterium]MBW2123590.1 methyltransferase domain-containing protein [Deltaproteobacteria bacterium]